MATTETAYFEFDSLLSAARALLTVLVHARVGTNEYRFGGLSAQQILASGLQLDGDIADIAAKLETIPGAFRHPD